MNEEIPSSQSTLESCFPLTAEERERIQLAQCAQDCLKRAAEIVEPARFEEDARAALQRLVDDRNVRIRHREAIRALRRALAVDIQKLANRKGELPKAIGLVSRESKAKNIKHWAIVLMMHRLLDWSEPHPATNDVLFLYPSTRRAADAVVIGFHAAEIDPALTPENVEKIWAIRSQSV